MTITFENETYRLDDLVATDKHGIFFRRLEIKMGLDYLDEEKEYSPDVQY